jgi:hypothetical protein
VERKVPHVKKRRRKRDKRKKPLRTSPGGRPVAGTIIRYGESFFDSFRQIASTAVLLMEDNGQRVAFAFNEERHAMIYVTTDRELAAAAEQALRSAGALDDMSEPHDGEPS